MLFFILFKNKKYKKQENKEVCNKKIDFLKKIRKLGLKPFIYLGFFDFLNAPYKDNINHNISLMIAPLL